MPGFKNHSLRDFDPAAVAAIETQMWQAYYSHQFARLFRLLLGLFRQQFGTKAITNLRLAFYSAKAAMVFRKSGNKPKTAKNLEKFYQILQRHSTESFDPKLAAKSELNWWKIHRYPKSGTLYKALAGNMSVLYDIAEEQLIEYGKQRAQAMNLRDTAEHKQKSEPDWPAIKENLTKSYTSLKNAVKTGQVS